MKKWLSIVLIALVAFTAPQFDSHAKTKNKAQITRVSKSSDWYPYIVMSIDAKRTSLQQAEKRYGKQNMLIAQAKYGKNLSIAKALKKIDLADADNHYKKHGAEFGKVTKAQYINKARQLLSMKTSKTVFEKRSSRTFNGKYRYYKYNAKTNEFLVVAKQDKIITFFKPNNGIKYWKAQ